MGNYSDDYKHFDTIIWQVPNWSTALFTGIIVSVYAIQPRSDENSSLYFPSFVMLILILIVGVVSISSFAYTLFRFRYHQKDPKIRLKANTSYLSFSKWLGAQIFLQVTINLEASILIGFLIKALTKSNCWGIAIAIFIFILLFIVFECIIHKQSKKDPDKSIFTIKGTTDTK